MAEVRLPWGAEERRRLREARRAAGHSQTACAERLRTLGAPVVAQSTVANWESGKTRRPADITIEAIAVYCADVLGEESAGEYMPHRDLDREFDEMVSYLTGAHPLTDRQERILEGLITRLSAGPAMSEHDLAAARTVLRLSGFVLEG